MNAESKPRRIIRGMTNLRKRLDNPAASTVHDWIKRRGFPKPVKLANGHSVAWDEADVAEWIEKHFSASKAEVA
jgi:hypothetical protein